MNVSVFVSTFLAASIEVIEMVAIVVAVGVPVARGARGDARGACGLGRPDRRAGYGVAVGGADAAPPRRGRAAARLRAAVATQGSPARLARRLGYRHRRPTGRGGR